MSEIRALHLDLIGVINNASSLPQDIKRILRKNRYIRVLKDMGDNGKWFAMVTFFRTKDGSFISPTTALTEKDINFFLIQAKNTYKGSTIVVKTGAKEKPGKIKVDGEENQRCNIRGAATIIRVSQNGNVEVYRVTSPTVDNKKQIRVFTRFEDILPFENEHLLNATIEDNEVLKEFADDIKRAHTETKEKKDREYERIEVPAEKEALVEKPETEETKEAPTEPETAPKPRKPEPKKKTAKGKSLKDLEAFKI